MSLILLDCVPLIEHTGSMARARGIPFVIEGGGARQALERLQLGAGKYSEAWLQELIHDQPEILPVSQIEPGFGTLVPIAREVPCGHGYIDNLLLTPSGEIVLIETKLWANSQARREVVAQALDYVAALTRMGYEAFQAAVAKAPSGPGKLYPCLAKMPDVLAEPEFIDAVSANLSRGRMLVLVVGDGIRREAEALTGLLQSHAGAHFTFALVELACWRNAASGSLLIVPDVLAHTVMIERGIVRLADSGMQVQSAPTTSSGPAKATTLSEEMFYEELGKSDPATAALVRAFLEQIEPLGVYADLKASLNLKADLPEYSKAVNFGYITKTGKVWTDPLSWRVAPEVAQAYNQALAQILQGSVASLPSGGIYVTINGKSAPRVTDLLPQHADAWAAAIARAIEAIRTSPANADA